MFNNCVTSNLVLQIKDDLKSGYQSKLPNTYYILLNVKMELGKLENIFFINYFAVQMKKCI